MKLFRKFRYYFRYPSELIEDLERFIAYRTYDKYHLLPTGLPPGYSDPREQLINVSFTLLKNFVEVELAAIEFYHSKPKLPFFKSFLYYLPYPFNYSIRSRELGLKYIEGMLELHKADEYSTKEYNDYHINFWNEVKFLYNWWYNRPDREEPMELSGLSLFDQTIREKYNSESVFKFIKNPNRSTSTMEFIGNAAERQEHDRLAQLMKDIEKQQNQEDEEMLIRLVKIRLFLWT